jgi:hypothetical protein
MVEDMVGSCKTWLELESLDVYGSEIKVIGLT